MIRLTASLLLGFLMTSAALADPISIFIRAGKKTHAPGAHEHEQFLQDWKPLLEARGARVTGGMEFPTAEQLKGVDVLILHAQEAGNIALGAERKALLDFLKRGGGLVVLHAGAVSRDPTWYRSIIGGSWNHSTPTQWLEAPMALYFTDRSNPITQDISNFDLDDEIYYDMDILPEAHILAAAYTPKAIDTGGRGNKEAQERAAEAVKLKKGVNIYDIQPQIWTYENRIDGAQRDYRAFVSIPGHWYRNFSHLGVRTLILRGIAWAAGRENVDELCQPEELGDALRYVEGGAPRPQDLPAQLEVHPDFELSLVASEPLINNPMNVTWDEKGRLWVVESPEYPNGLREANVETWKDSGSLQPGQYQREPQDRVSILRDEDGDGVMDAKTVFADQIELATSLALYRNGVIVCAAPNIWFFEDTDGDDVADRRTKLYSNLGDRDTHAVINNLRWGRDGWIYATHGYSATSDVLSGDGQRSFGPAGSGVVRFKPDGSAFEQYASRGGNTWGLDLTTGGEVFYTQPTTGNPLVHVMLPEPILAEGKLPGVDGTVGLLPGEATFPAMEWQHQAYVQIDQVGRYTAGAGCAIYEGGAWPDSWNFSYFVGEPTLNIVGQYFVTPDGSGFQAHKEADRANTEFIRSRNMWFRPIDTRIGPDGALYITDFCNQAVIHNDTRGPTHGPANAAVRPDRDHYYGRIWRVQHRQAQSLPRLALDRKDIAGLEKAAASSANGTVKDIARRLLREETGAPGERVGSAAVRAYDAARQETDAEKILAQVRSAPDDWILSALVAAAAPRAGEVIAAALSAPVSQPVSRFATALVPAALAHDEAAAATLVRACAEAKGEAALRREVLTAIASGSASKHAPDAATQTALAQLLQEPETVTPALSLFSQWGLAATMAEPVKAVTTRLQATLADASAPLDQRTRAASSLVAVGGAAADSALVLLGEAQQPEPLHRALIDAADRTGHAELIVSHYAALPAPMQRPAFEAILRRPPATEALLTALEAGSIPTDSFAPGDVARLRSHPNKLIARRADRIFQVNLAAKDAIISSLIPEVEKPGDADKGQILFAACAVCHKLGGNGTEVGPALDGMGAHGPAELLVHIIDPNREVDPSFWAHSVTLQKGELLTGVVVSENATSLTLATQTGRRELAKKDIAKDENTRRSLMPEGFEALGAEALRDLLAFICDSADHTHRVVNLRDVFTTSSESGSFASERDKDQTVKLKRFGDVVVEGIPFFILDPRKSATGANIITLQGGHADTYAQTLPDRVRIPIRAEAASMHFLGGVGGWAWPYGGDKFRDQPAMTVVVHYADEDSETFTLKNGVHFADYIGTADVPQSQQLVDFTNRGQLRYFALNLKRKARLEAVELITGGNVVAPCTVALTLSTEPAKLSDAPASAPQAPEKPKKGNAKAKGPNEPPPIPAAPVRWQPDKLKVLLIGGGSSHNFVQYFGKADTAFLEQAGFSVLYTEDRTQATEQLAEADVAVISVNRSFFDTPAYREALMKRLAAGKGVIMLHPGTWYGYKNWPELNAQIVGGGARGHDKLGPFSVTVLKPEHPIMQGVPERFDVVDELYYINAEGVPEGTAPISVLAQTSPSQKYGQPHPSVWTTQHPSARVAGIALGHDDRTHDEAAYQRILINAIHWVAGE